MASEEISTSRREAKVSGAPAQPAPSPRGTVTMDGDTGRTHIHTSDAPAEGSRASVIAAAKARAAEREKSGKPAGRAVQQVVGSGPEGEEVTTSEANVEPITGGDGAADPDAGAAPAPEGDAAQDADEQDDEGGTGPEREGDPDPAVDPPADATATPKEPAAEPAADLVQVRHELEQARAMLFDAQRELDDRVSGSRTSSLESLIRDPLGWVRAKLAEDLGVAADADLVNEEVQHLTSELTWSHLGMQDVPEQDAAKLKTDRLHRAVHRLDPVRRQAEQEAQKRASMLDSAREYAASLYASVRDKFPHLQAAEDIDGRDASDVIVSTVMRLAAEGRIKAGTTEEAAFLEAIRLADPVYQQRLTKIAKRAATLSKATVPTAPGGGTQQSAKGTTTTTPQAGTGKKPQSPASPPRTLSSANAGAAPQRPGPGADAKPKDDKIAFAPITADDRESGRKRVLDKYRKPQQ